MRTIANLFLLASLLLCSSIIFANREAASIAEKITGTPSQPLNKNDILMGYAGKDIDQKSILQDQSQLFG